MIARARGFRDSSVDNIQLSGGQGSTLNVTINVAATTEQITVSGAPPLLQTANANVGAVIEGKRLESLPVLGRDFTSLLLTLPGVSPATPASSSRGGPMSVGGTGVNPSINGQRWRNNNYTLDGVANNEPLFNRVPLMPTPEAVAEMKMEITLSSGANGHASGAKINLVTRSESNAFHDRTSRVSAPGHLEQRRLIRVRRTRPTAVPSYTVLSPWIRRPAVLG